MKYAYMNERDEKLIQYINKHYQELLVEIEAVGSFDEFIKGGVLTKAIKMDILQIAENINSLSKETSSHLNAKDLRGIVDIRNHIAHGYIMVDDKIVWNAICERLPKLIEEINLLK